MDDDELIGAVARGDDAALRVLFDRHAPWLAARLRTALPAADVEDVLQETFVAVWRGGETLRAARDLLGCDRDVGARAVAHWGRLLTGPRAADRRLAGWPAR